MPSQIWTPRKESECKSDWGTLDRPAAIPMFYAAVNNSYTYNWTDHYTGKAINFGRTLSGSDNKMENLLEVWSHTGYGMTTGYCKKDNYISWHVGVTPDIDTLANIKSYSQHMLPGYVGLRFQYRWPDTNSRNYWSNSPIHINDAMLHYYNFEADEIWHYEIKLSAVSTTNANHRPDRYVDDSGRRSNTWKGVYYKPEETGARSEIRDNQLFMIGASFEMKYSDRGTASHSRCMDIRNMTPIWDSASGHGYRPCLGVPRPDTWTSKGPLQLYLV